MSVPGNSVAYTCLTASGEEIVSVQWFINGSLYDESCPNINASFVSELNLGILEFINLPVIFNMTTISCAATFSSQRTINARRESLLVIQGAYVTIIDNFTRITACIGQLASVGSLMIDRNDSFLFVSWEAPFTLDIFGVDPDITYCVNASSALFGECMIEITNFTHPIPSLTECNVDTFEITVTPVNPFGNGIEDLITYMYPQDENREWNKARKRCTMYQCCEGQIYSE